MDVFQDKIKCILAHPICSLYFAFWFLFNSFENMRLFFSIYFANFLHGLFLLFSGWNLSESTRVSTVRQRQQGRLK